VTSAGTNGSGLGLTGISTPLTLTPNQSSTFNVTFEPSSSGLVNGTVYLANDSATPSIAIPVSGAGVPAPAHEVDLRWSDSGSDVIGYFPYRRTVTGGPYTKLSSSPTPQASYIDQGVQASNTYFYIVTAVSADMLESAFADEVQATMPTP